MSFIENITERLSGQIGHDHGVSQKQTLIGDAMRSFVSVFGHDSKNGHLDSRILPFRRIARELHRELHPKQ